MFLMYFAMVFGDGASSTERSTSFSCIFSDESSGFSLLIRFIRAIVSGDIFGLPGLLISSSNKT